MFETIQVGDHLVVQGKWDDSVFGDPTSGMYSVCNLKNTVVIYDQTDTKSLSWLGVGYAPCPGFEEAEGVRVIDVLNDFFSDQSWNWYVGVARSGDDNGDGKPESIEKGVEIVEFSGWAVQTT